MTTGRSESKRSIRRRSNTIKRCDYRVSRQSIPGDMLDCGCRSISLYECEWFSELVLLQPIIEDHDRVIQGNRHRYLGRTCHRCFIESE